MKWRRGIVSAWRDLQLGATSAPAALLRPASSPGELSAWRWWAANTNSSRCSKSFYHTAFSSRGNRIFFFCPVVTAHSRDGRKQARGTETRRERRGDADIHNQITSLKAAFLVEVARKWRGPPAVRASLSVRHSSAGTGQVLDLSASTRLIKGERLFQALRLMCCALRLACLPCSRFPRAE